MKRIYETEISKKSEVTKILEAEPYADDSFARVGYKIKEGSAIEENKEKLYVYISASEDFIKKADEKLKPILKVADKQTEQRIVEKIQKEEEAAESGLGDIFG